MLIVICLFTISYVHAQQSLLAADPDNRSYKSALKEAKKENAPVLALLYSQDQPSESSNDFTDLNQTITKTGYRLL